MRASKRRLRLWVVLGVLAAAALVSIKLMHSDGPAGATGIARYHGAGVALDLPDNWVASADPRELPLPSGLNEHDTQEVTAYLADPSLLDESTRLVGYQGYRTVVVVALATKREGELSAAIDSYVTDQTDRQGFILISRDPTSVDGNQAERMVFEKPQNQERTLDIAWLEGDQAWLMSWDTSTRDFSEAEPVFDAATKTVWTESGASSGG